MKADFKAAKKCAKLFHEDYGSIGDLASTLLELERLARAVCTNTYRLEQDDAIEALRKFLGEE